MKKFLLNFILFIIPILLVFVTAEYILRQNQFEAKKDFIKDNKEDIKVMITGPSHAEIGINPEFIDYSTINFATSSGFFKIDKAIIEKYIVDFPNLDMLIVSFPVSYLEIPSPKSFPRRSIYKIYYGVDYDNPSLSDNFLLASSFRLSFSSLKQILLNDYKVDYNKFGFVKNIPEEYNLFKNLDYDTDRIRKDPKLKNQFRLHERYGVKAKKENIEFAQEIIKLCKENNKKLVFISLPKYHLFNKRVPEKFYENREEFFKNHSKDSYLFWNFDTWNDTNPKIFKDFNHLNPKGAEAFTKMLNDSINKYVR